MNVMLDSSALGRLTHPNLAQCGPIARALVEISRAGAARILVPEIADYELRRELIRARRAMSVMKLDLLQHEYGYLPLDTSVMRHTAELWALARAKGRKTAPDERLDIDMILIAQALSCSAEIWTTNVKHLSSYVPVRNIDDL